MITVPPPVITTMPPPVVIPTPPVAITPAEPIEGTQTGPEYPIISRRLAEQGTVRLRLTIGEDGMVKMADVTHSSGFKRLDDVAKDWVLRHWRYRPAMRGPMPVESQTEGVLQFVLK
jgi:protein TonB